MRISENILISSLTTMRLGGPAKYVIEVEQPSEIPEAYSFAAMNGLPTFILGYGANTIGHDEGFNGVIIINRMRGITEESITSAGGASNNSLSEGVADMEGFPRSSRREEPWEGNVRQDPLHIIKIMGGEYWDDVVAYACERGLTGIEALSRIPSLTAAAPVQNIGAYGQEIADTLDSIEAYDTTAGTFVTLTKADLQFSYRHSILNTTKQGRYFVISITLNLKPGQMSRPFYDSIEHYIDEHHITDFSPASIRAIVSAIRASKLPDPADKASAGSFFKNIYLNDAEADIAESKGYPIYRSKNGNKLNSAWLIEQAGLKGQLLHGIRVSNQAPLVLINESATSYTDLAAARTEIVNKVYDKFGYWLEQEPVEITNK